MAESNSIPGNLRVGGQLVPVSIVLPSSSVTDTAVQAAAGIQASKLQQQYAITYRQKTGADITSATEDVYVVRGVSGTVIGVDVVTATAPTGGDKAFTVDVLKGNQSTSFATLLNSVVTINNTKVNRQVVGASLVASPTLADNDTIRVVVATSGSTGSQGQGLVVTISTREDPD
jgi:hypothetical protein